MSNSLAIAAVTATLYNLLFIEIREELGSGMITTLPLDQARVNREGNQVNIFLYHTFPNVAWRNNQRPSRANQNPAGKQPIGLDLYYLVTVYGENDSETKSHRLLGRVMTVLHDHPVLTPGEVEAATGIEVPESDLHQQLEQIIISPEYLSFEAMSQLWRGFQAQYRISTAYKVSVVMLDSTLPAKVPLPVLSRNWDNREVAVFPNLAPVLRWFRLPHRQLSAQLGDTMTIYGEHLDNPHLGIRLRHNRSSDVIELSPQPGGTGTQIQVQLPQISANQPVVTQWRAGVYSLFAVVQRANYTWTTNELPFTLSAQLLSVTPQEAPAGRVVLTLACCPQIHPQQQVILIFGDRTVPVHHISSPTDLTQPSTLTFKVRATRQGLYVLRLRVDGVDSIPIDFSSTPLQFAANQTVRIISSSSRKEQKG